jgi:hypothetical protein
MNSLITLPKVGVIGTLKFIFITLKKNFSNTYPLKNIFMEGQGRGKTNKTMMISNFRISNETAKKILENYKHKKERIDLI